MLCRSYADLYPLMLRDLPSCERPDALLALQLAGREFCNRTEVWKATLDPVDIVADTLVYTLVWGEDAFIKKVTKLTYDGFELNGSLYTFSPPSTIEFVDFTPTQSIAGGLVVDAIFVPSLTTNEIADFVFERWAEAFVAKAVSSLALMPGKPWSNPALGGLSLSRYNEKVAEAMASESSGYKSGGSGLEA